MRWRQSPEHCTIACTAPRWPSGTGARAGPKETMALCDLRVTQDPSPRRETRQYFQTMINAQSAGHHGEVERFQLRRGEMYRISYTVRTPQQRRVTRSLAIYAGSSKRRLWDGREAVCFEFQRPHGRPLSLLRGQIVEARPGDLERSRSTGACRGGRCNGARCRAALPHEVHGRHLRGQLARPVSSPSVEALRDSRSLRPRRSNR